MTNPHKTYRRCAVVITAAIVAWVGLQWYAELTSWPKVYPYATGPINGAFILHRDGSITHP